MKEKKDALFPKINNTAAINYKEAKNPYIKLKHKTKKKKNTDKS